MNQEPWGAPRQAQPMAGSVRAARQRVEAGIPRTMPQPYQNNVQNSRPQGLPNGPLISRPAPMPQWPLVASAEDGMGKQMSINPEDRTDIRGAPPQRPPRPSYVPSILDASRIQEHTPPFQYRQQQQQAQQRNNPQQSRPVAQSQQQPKYWESNNPSSPQDPYASGAGLSSTSSRPSTSSSVGSIPDFPVPSMPNNLQQQQQQQQQQPRRSANLGPPPSSRRGASSYYSQSSYVAPIPEEYPEAPKVAKQKAGFNDKVPQNWSDGPSTYYISGVTNDDDYEDDDEVNIRDSRSTEPDEQTNLVRKASLGKQYKPSLTTVRSGSSSSSGDSNKPGNEKSGKPNMISRVAISAGATAGAFAAGLGNSKDNQALANEKGVPSRTTFLDRPSDESTNRSITRSDEGNTRPEVSSGTDQTSPVDPRVEEILGGLQKGGAIDSTTTVPLLQPSTGPGQRRPPRLDIDAVKAAEQRGSLTSLSDLIRRATKVAANLDKGRTASRLGMLDMFNSSNPNLLDKHDRELKSRIFRTIDINHCAANRPRNSISDILNSFPPPGLHTPTPSGDRPVSRWPSPFANSNNHLAATMTSESKTEKVYEKRSRKCCGLPLWAFMLLLILVFILVAAAVVIPIVLIVIPRQSSSQTPPVSTLDLTKCATSNPCGNGGTSVVSANSCRCVCSNGFTGSTCKNSADSSCSTSNQSGFKNVTLGTSISRLLSGAQLDFSIPLNATSLLAVFSATNLSCSDENALVTFSGQSLRRSIQNVVIHPDSPPLPMVTLAPRVPQQPEGSDSFTSNGIVFANSGSPVTRTSSGASPSATAAPSGSGPEQKDFDFARTAVLYILQEAQLDAAVDGRTKLQAALGKIPFVAEPVKFSGNITVDFLTRGISIGDKRVGGNSTE